MHSTVGNSIREIEKRIERYGQGRRVAQEKMRLRRSDSCGRARRKKKYLAAELSWFWKINWCRADDGET